MLLACVGGTYAVVVPTGTAAQEAERPSAIIDVGSSTPVVASASQSLLPIDFSVACAMPDPQDECDVSTTLHYKAAGSQWSPITKLLPGFDVKFLVPVPSAPRVDYYLEVRERSTGTTFTFPEGGSATPLSFHVVSFNDPVRLAPLPFDVGTRAHETVVRMPWGTAPGEAGLIPGNEGSTIGPQAADVAEDGSVYVLDQVNDRVQVFDSSGLPLNVIPMDLGPLGDIALSDDGGVNVLDVVPTGAGSHPVVHEITRLDVPFSPSVTVESSVTAEREPALLRVKDGTTWVYGTPSDSWRPLPDGTGPPKLQMGMPSSVGELLRRVTDLRRVDILPVSSEPRGRITLLAPADRFFGELAMVEPDGEGGYWIVVRTWHEEPVNEDQHELVHASASGEVLEHTALRNSEYAEFAPLSQFRMGGDGNLYQLWSDEAGFEVRRFNL